MKGDPEAITVRVTVAFLVLILLSFAFALPVMWCWNGCVPHITRMVLPRLGFWQAFCLHWLTSFLFVYKIKVTAAE